MGQNFMECQINLVKLLLARTDMVIDKIKKDIQKYFYDHYPKYFDKERLDMEKKKIAVEEELHEVGQMPTALPNEIFTIGKDNKQSGNTPKSYAEVWNDAKPKEIVKIGNAESHQNAPNRVTSTEVRIF